MTKSKRWDEAHLSEDPAVELLQELGYTYVEPETLGTWTSRTTKSESMSLWRSRSSANWRWNEGRRKLKMSGYLERVGRLDLVHSMISPVAFPKRLLRTDL